MTTSRSDDAAPRTRGRAGPTTTVAITLAVAAVLAGAFALLGRVGSVREPAARPAPPSDTHPSDTPPSVDRPSGCEGAGTRVSGRQDEPFRTDRLAAREVIDARSATWPGTDAGGDPIDWTITLDGEGPGCWLGGTWTGAWVDTDPDVTWEEPYHHAGLVTLRLADFTVAGITATNHGDGIRMDRGADDFRIVGVNLSDIHDDCIENDYMRGGIVEDSLLDGCYVAFSAASHSGNDDSGRGRTWEIRDNLVRLEPQPTTYSGPSPGHGQLFKWDDDAPTVDLVGNVFRIDQPPNHGSIGIPDEMDLGTCADNVVVWGGEGPYPEPLPDCFTVTTDRSTWDRAVAAWHRTHVPPT